MRRCGPCPGCLAVVRTGTQRAGVPGPRPCAEDGCLEIVCETPVGFVAAAKDPEHGPRPEDPWRLRCWNCLCQVVWRRQATQSGVRARPAGTANGVVVRQSQLRCGGCSGAGDGTRQNQKEKLQGFVPAAFRFEAHRFSRHWFAQSRLIPLASLRMKTIQCKAG